MRVLPKPGILEKLQKELDKTDQEFAEFIGVSRSQLWRAKLKPTDKRFSLGQDFIAKMLQAFNSYKFEELFFLQDVSHVCDKTELQDIH
jgi:predicted transcriptional regulator